MVFRGDHSLEEKSEKKKNQKTVAAIFLVTGILSLGLWIFQNGGINLNTGFSKILSFEVEVPRERDKRDTSHETKNFQKKLTEKVRDLTGNYSVYVFRPEEGRGYGINENKIMPAMSFMKVPVMIESLLMIDDGKLKLDDKIEIRSEDKKDTIRSIDKKPVGSEVSVDELLKAAGIESDNTAAAILTRISSDEAIERLRGEMEMENTNFSEYETTALDTAMMWNFIFKNNFEVIDYLTESIYEDRIPQGVPSDVTVVHKVGTGDGIWSDGGIVKCPVDSCQLSVEPFILVIMSENVDMDEAKAAVPEITRMIWEYESKRR